MFANLTAEPSLPCAVCLFPVGSRLPSFLSPLGLSFCVWPKGMTVRKAKVAAGAKQEAASSGAPQGIPRGLAWTWRSFR